MASEQRPRRPATPVAVVFDVDGVLVASPHERAWRDALEELMATAWRDVPSTYTPAAFTTAVYQEHVAGKARHSGARAALEYFHVPDAAQRAHEYAERKQRMIERLIDAGEFVAFPDAIRLLLGLVARGVRLAAASSSKNANRFMEQIRLDTFAREQGLTALAIPSGRTLRDVFHGNVCGVDVPHGKPHPDLFLLGAEAVGIPPRDCVVIEDAPSGVQAAKAAGMLAIGIARLRDEDLLASAGADLVVTSLDDVSVDALVAGRAERRPADGSSGTRIAASPDHARLDASVAAMLEPPDDPAWVLREDGYIPLRESGIESRFAISNGFLGVRGSRAISRGPMWVSFLHTLSWASWPRTFVAGLFDTPNTEPPVPALLPAPDWLRVRVLLEGEPLLIRSGELLAHARMLDMRRGVLLTEWQQRDPGGRIVVLRALRLVSLSDRAVGMQLVQLSVGGGAAAVTLEAPLELANSGLELVGPAERDVSVWKTADSDRYVAMASAVDLHVDGRAMAPTSDEQQRRTWAWNSAPGSVATLRRMVAVSRGDAGADPAALRDRTRGALDHARRGGWHGVLAAHVDAWAARWRCSDVAVEGDDEAQRALRFAIYHLNSAANPEDEHVSIGARALTGDAYLGHVFWDTEIYLLPFYVLTWPEAARALLMYRWHTIAGARAKAVRLGYRGALYAWESADTGEETTPEQIVDPDGRVIEVLCGTLEQHISADVAYAVIQYWRATGDDAFMAAAGAEIVLDTARFWSSRVTWQDGRAHIRDVIGPDEYHEHVDDNAFTNVMAAWNLRRGLEVAAWLQAERPERWSALASALRIDADELPAWERTAAHLVTGFDARTGYYEQFAGYFGLEDIDLQQYAGRTAPMDVVLGRERTQRSQVVKQADVVALLALLPEGLDRHVLDANLAYYGPRCGHGSSLSRSMHAVVAARLGYVEEAERYFQETAATDLADTRGGSAGGVRIAALGGLWQSVMLGFAGLTLRDDGLGFTPHLPARWRSLAFRVQWRGRSLAMRMDARARSVTATLEHGAPMALAVGEAVHRLTTDTALRVPWDIGATPTPHHRQPDAGSAGA